MRDRLGAGPGHLGILSVDDKAIAVRHQGANQIASICSQLPLGLDGWHHIGVNFGGGKPLALYVDGVEQLPSATVVVADVVSLPCDDVLDYQGGFNNDLPWVVGASTMGRAEPPSGPLRLPLGGAIDNLRISNVRRDFSAAPPGGG